MCLLGTFDGRQRSVPANHRTAPVAVLHGRSASSGALLSEGLPESPQETAPTVGNPRFDLIVKRRHAIHQEHRVVHACRSGRLGSAERAYRIHVESRRTARQAAASRRPQCTRPCRSHRNPAPHARTPFREPPHQAPTHPSVRPTRRRRSKSNRCTPKTLRKREPFMQSGSSRAHAFPFRARNGFRAIYLNSPAKQTLRGCDLTCWANGAAAMPHYARVRISSHTFAIKSAVSNGCVSLERSRTAMLPSSASFSPTTII